MSDGLKNTIRQGKVYQACNYKASPLTWVAIYGVLILCLIAFLH
jgi:amino acid permease